MQLSTELAELEGGWELHWGASEEQFFLFGLREVPLPQPDRKVVLYRISEPPEPLLTGRAIGRGVTSGKVHVIRGEADLEDFQSGQILVAQSTQPSWEPQFKKAVALITAHDRRVSHSTILARELGIPAVSEAHELALLQDGQTITVSCCQGEQARIYEGEVDWRSEEFSLDRIEELPLALMVGLSQPEQAVETALLPWAGVGLCRSEFILNGWVRVHPLALLGYDELPAEIQTTVDRLCRGTTDRAGYLVERLTRGLATVAGAFWPRPVRVRLSDFKSNEYARMAGGHLFEPEEPNPALGWRGASRYLDPEYQEAFLLEVEALRVVREDLGFSNLELIVAFCRTPEEAHLVLEPLPQAPVWLMAELPSHVFLAREFAQMFDGFSVGSNDLTQLTLGLDRDCDRLAFLFDERHRALMTAYDQLLEAACEFSKPVGFCGQLVSDRPEFIWELAAKGFGSVTVAPDALVPTLASWLEESEASPSPLRSRSL